ncbi:hypothetical protein L1987_37933 [Smallanthus sonchifolius]|uniref:Uncharacterized protein n=1 Tax=Smallanthus sonchifolius TaxID=185202 RepID=A0ACB9HK96_9ASTR|nr:hypothetical protein L1987_37933 [Smallanthus sonchifolius]
MDLSTEISQGIERRGLQYFAGITAGGFSQHSGPDIGGTRLSQFEMVGGHGYGNGTYKGVHLHQPKRWHTVTGKGMCAMMWFWILYRAKQDGPVVLGWRHPWEGHGHGDEH